MILDEKIHLLQNTDILSEEGKTTVAGLLVFGINPQRNLQNALISFAHYQGKSTSEFINVPQVFHEFDDDRIDGIWHASS